MDFSNRLKIALDDKNMKAVDLANLTGIGKSSISAYLKGDYEAKQKNLYKIAMALDVDEAWLMGLDSTETLSVLTPLPSPTISLPYLGTVAAGAFEHAIELSDEITVPEHIISESIENYFVLKTSGDSMNKTIANGHYVVVKDLRNSLYNFKSNDILIVRNGSEYTMKRVRKTDTMVHLEPDSYIDEFITQSYQLDNLDDMEVIGRVVYSFREFN